MPYEWLIGLRYLKARRGQRFLSLITWISIGGVAVGVMALLVVLAVMSGFERDLRAKILGVNAHIWVLKFGERALDDPDRVLREVRATPGVAGAVPFTFHQVMLSASRTAVGAVLRGMDLEGAGPVLDLPHAVKETDPRLLRREGDGLRLAPDGILLGRVLAANLGLRVGDSVIVISPQGTILTPFGLAPRVRSFAVGGVFDVGMHEYDAGLAVVTLATAQGLFQMGTAVSGIEVKVNDVDRAAAVARAILARLGFPYYTRDWLQMNRNLWAALQLEKLAMFVILLFIVMVAAFNIVSTLTMGVMDKSAAIGILKSMGATGRGIMRIFMVQGVIIGAVGTVVGAALGGLICYLQAAYRIVQLKGDVYFLSVLPIQVKPWDVAWVVAASLTLSFLATLYPSWKAARLDPVAAIRYG
ncbi:MAG TPA: lipoprotein-releasing ABC transporter permease subunit [Candidatus Methylomirabilis sp.]|jgi:lipoprotein-releasing system permease protein